MTLGYNEKDDIKHVVKALQEMSFISEYIKLYNWNKLLAISIAIWGRSMGATSAILYTSNNDSDNIIGLILDSPFLNLSQLCFDQIKTYVLHVKKYRKYFKSENRPLQLCSQIFSLTKFEE